MNNRDEQVYSIALTLLPGIGRIGAKQLVEGMGTATDVFRLRRELPDRLPEAGKRLVQLLDNPQAIARADRELTSMEEKQVRCIAWASRDYPRRLRECPDAPVALFYRGSVDLNSSRIISMVGTRQATDYGRTLCREFLHGLSQLCPDVLVVSGLAYGIDVCAHREAMAHGLSTVGVLAHGLDRIYPSNHRSVAVQMMERGGLLTEYVFGTEPERYNFVGRNRIVAGMADATIVVESGKKGGSLITADLANGYHRECFAFPGRVTDVSSEGCNCLLRDNKAAPLLSAEDFVAAMGWGAADKKKAAQVRQQTLFPELSPEEQRVLGLLQHEENRQLDALVLASQMPVARLHAILFELEMKGAVRTAAGGLYIPI